MADYIIDIRKPTAGFVTEALRVGDNGMREFKFHFCDGGEPFVIPDGTVATLFAVLPDEISTTVYCPCEIADNTAIFTLTGSVDEPPALTSYPGEVMCELRLTSTEGRVLTSPPFSFTVEPVYQNDSAIEAQESFSALTAALGRVIDAENGLASKMDRVSGTEGNAAVFSTDGTVKDAGYAPCTAFIFTFDETGTYEDQENRATLNAMNAAMDAGIPFSVFIKDSGNILMPATIKGRAARREILAMNEFFDKMLSIAFSTSSATYSESILYNYEHAFNETDDVPASQKRVADWVKAYVNDTVAEGEW